MRILLTNDDGHLAAGIQILAEVLGRDHHTCILAPDRERSAQSHAMTLRDPLVVRQHGPDHYSCSGTPADCVILARHGVLPFEPELVVSGINRGPNLGTDLIYSGTAAAARQAVLSGWPGIAVSLASFGPDYHYRALAELLAERLDELTARSGDGHFVNLNADNAADSHRYELLWTFPSRRLYRDTLRTVDGADGQRFCFYTDGKVLSVEQDGSDEHAVRMGKAAASAIAVYPQGAQ